jgi:formyltetrahydrofolate synthetase
LGAHLGLKERHLTLHGWYRGKLDPGLLREDSSRRGRYVLVSAITPAVAGDIMTMPGLPSHPCVTQIDLDDVGESIRLV